MALGFIIGFILGAAVVAYFMAAPIMRLSEDERNDIVRKIQAAGWRKKKVIASSVHLRPYKIHPNVIKNYDEAYPYLVVAEMPNSTKVEYWWVGTACAIEHSCCAEKYKQLGYSVISEPVREENNG